MHRVINGHQQKKKKIQGLNFQIFDVLKDHFGFLLDGIYYSEVSYIPDIIICKWIGIRFQVLFLKKFLVCQKFSIFDLGLMLLVVIKKNTKQQVIFFLNHRSPIIYAD